jgi:hypothetical protein
MEPAEDGRHGGPHQTGRCDPPAPDAGLGGFDIPHQANGGFVKIAAGIGERHAARSPQQQLSAEMRLKRGDLLADRRLANAKRAGDGGKAAAVDHSNETLEFIPIWN